MKSQNKFLFTALTAAAAFAAASALRRRREYDFEDKVVLITGGSRGLGLVLARQLAKEGAHLAICARDADELKRACEDLTSSTTNVLTINCDVTQKSDVDQMMARVLSHYGRVDVLVNNAGVIEVGPLEVMTIEDFKAAMNTHFWGPVNTSMAVLPEMRRAGHGRIVNISSIGGKVSVPHLLPYCSSKFALVGFSEGLRAACAKDGIVVTTVCPGLMRTGSARNAEFKGKHRAEYALFSLSAALPFTSMNVERAARQIVAACRRGDAEVVLSLQAKLVAIFHDVFPEATSELMACVNQLLPGPGGIGTNIAKGKDSSSFLAPSFVTALNDKAAVRNNEMG